MGILRRISKATRASLTDIRKRTFGEDDKPLSELSDRELEEEILRRRRARAQRTGRRPDDDRREALNPQRKQLRQYFANLELEPGASLEDVKRAYKDLMRRYHPDKHVGDPDKHRAATELAQSLTEAYRNLTAHLERRS